MARSSHRLAWLALAGYLVLLAASHGVRALAPAVGQAPGVARVAVRPAPDALPQPLAYATRDAEGTEGAGDAEGAPNANRSSGAPVVLIHDTATPPEALRALAGAFPDTTRVVRPHLPGFGASPVGASGLAARAHARTLAAWLDTLGVRRVHLVGVGTGGRVALHLADRLGAAPAVEASAGAVEASAGAVEASAGAVEASAGAGEASGRVASVALVAASGVAEMELLGSVRLNQALFRAYLGALGVLHAAVPHFGALDRPPFTQAHARVLLRTDARAVRPLLRRLHPPTLVVHGAADARVPLVAAREHARLVPQSRLATFDGDHDLARAAPAAVARRVAAFQRAAAQGRAPTRATADPVRLRAAAVPFDPTARPPATGATFLVVALLIGALTLVSEDVACIAAGLLAAYGTLSFATATGLTYASILVGDLLLYAAGRRLGRPALQWLLPDGALTRATAWIRQRGAYVVFISRVIPGSRVPVYVGCGTLRFPVGRFLLYLALAALPWTPAMVGLAMLFGEQALALVDRYTAWAWIGALALAAAWAVARVVPPLFTWRGRRRMRGWWTRLTRWTYWPRAVVYLPVLAYLAALAVRYRSAAVFAAANPALPMGGFVGTSKAALLDRLRDAVDGMDGANGRDDEDGVPPVAVPPHAAVEPGTVAARADAVAAFMQRHDLAFPVVLKPDVRERGEGVAVVRDAAALRAHLAAWPGRLVAQGYVAGAEFDLLYVRPPGARTGRLLSVAAKTFPTVTGDGVRSLEALALARDDTAPMAAAYFGPRGLDADAVPAAGVRVRLLDVGTHPRGVLVRDARALATPALVRRLDALADALGGFHLGRLDVRAPDADALQAGRGLTVLDLNGVAAEPTHVYDPAVSILDAYRALRQTWRWAFRIGAAQAEAGAAVPAARRLARRLRRYGLGLGRMDADAH